MWVRGFFGTKKIKTARPRGTGRAEQDGSAELGIPRRLTIELIGRRLVPTKRAPAEADVGSLYACGMQVAVVFCPYLLTTDGSLAWPMFPSVQVLWL
jgi:hypothetical protein